MDGGRERQEGLEKLNRGREGGRERWKNGGKDRGRNGGREYMFDKDKVYKGLMRCIFLRTLYLISGCEVPQECILVSPIHHRPALRQSNRTAVQGLVPLLRHCEG